MNDISIKAYQIILFDISARYFSLAILAYIFQLDILVRYFNLDIEINAAIFFHWLISHA